MLSLFLFALPVAYLHNFYKAMYIIIIASNIKHQDSLENFVFDVKLFTLKCWCHEGMHDFPQNGL